MSTTIYNGYRLAAGTDPFHFLARLRAVMDPARDAADAKLLAGLYAEAIDRAWFAGKPVPCDVGIEAWRAWYGEQSLMKPSERRQDPNGFGIQIGLDPETGRYLILLLTENDGLREVFEAMDEVEEYGYWDNTDSYPDGVTREDWEIREAAWNRVIDRPGYTNMVDFRLRPPYDQGARRFLGIDGEDTSPVFAQLPTSRERARPVGSDAYGSYLAREKNIDPMTAAQFVVFNRSKNLAAIVDLVESYLPEITPELVAEGSGRTVIDPGYKEALTAACAALYELDKEKLSR